MSGECCEEVENDVLPDELVQSEPRLVWEIDSEDFVYTVDVSGDLRYCAFGGVSKVVHVLDGRTGRPLFKRPTAATVWTVKLLGDSKLAFGGESTSVTVVDVDTQATFLQIPVSSAVYSLVVSPHSLCFSHGSQCTVFGKGTPQYTWLDQPSTQVVMEIAYSLFSVVRTKTQTIRSAICVSHKSHASLRVVLIASCSSTGRGASEVYVLHYCTPPINCQRFRDRCK